MEEVANRGLRKRPKRRPDGRAHRAEETKGQLSVNLFGEMRINQPDVYSIALKLM